MKGYKLVALQRSFFGGRFVFSIPVSVYWFALPTVVIEGQACGVVSGEHWAISLCWLRRGFRLARKDPDRWHIIGTIYNEWNPDGPRKARIYFDCEWMEYEVRLIVNGKDVEDATYYTNDKQDAFDIASRMVETK